MVTIITGEKNSGKTTFFAYWYDEVQRGSGFYTKKIYEGNRLQGYEVVCLPDKRVLPFITVVQPQRVYESGGIATEQRVTDVAALTEVAVRLRKCLEVPDEPVWIDEVGRAELDGQGIDGLIRRILRRCTDVRLVVRKELLRRVIGHYGIERFNLVYV